MKKVILTAAVMVLTGMPAFASQAAADGQVIFTCRSLPNADSNILVLGVAEEKLSEVEVVVLIAGQVMAYDQGVLVPHTSRYEGRVFDMNFAETVTITAKAANAVLSVGQSDSLNCEF